MKNLKRLMGVVTIFAMLFTSCSKEDESPNGLEDQKATLSFATILNDMMSNKASAKQMVGEIPACSDDSPAFVEVVLSQDGTQVVGTTDAPLRVNVNPTPGDYDEDGVAEYFTEESASLELEAGNYTLEYFVVLNAAEEVIWVAPALGADLAGFVTNTLPLNINLGTGVKKYVDVEVLCFDDRLVNAYGYLFFDIEQREAFEYCFFANYCDPNGRHYPGRISVDVWVVDEDGDRDYIYEDVINDAGYHGDDIYAEPVCLVLPNLSEYADAEEYIFYEVTLISWPRAYGTVGRNFHVESGALSRNEVLANYSGDDRVEYDHIRFGCD